MAEFTNVWITNDRTTLAFEIDDGEGGLYVYQAGYTTADEVQELTGTDWISLGGGRSLGHGR